jgi:hypothetical protein
MDTPPRDYSVQVLNLATAYQLLNEIKFGNDKKISEEEAIHTESCVRILEAISELSGKVKRQI